MNDVTAETPGDAAEPVEGERGGFGSLGSIIYLLAITWAAGIASFPLNDNSFFTHLATGRLILERGSVPSTDPYTFTAYGEPWTVQSWLASVAYAGAEQLAGDIGLRLLVLAVFAGAISVLWALTSPVESIVVRLLILAGALFVVTDLWSERPYMVGVIGLGLVWLSLESKLQPWMLVPLMWVWVNSHGSWILAPVLAATFVVGAAFDRHASRAPWWPTRLERQVASSIVVGTLLGAVGPLGPKVLWFPFSALTKSETFAEIVEWRSPAYRSIAERSYLLLVLIAVLLLVRKGSWRLTVPTVVFAAAGLSAQRNIVMATVVLVATCAAAAPNVGTLTGRDRPRTGPVLAGVLVLLTVAVGAVAVAAPVLSPRALGGYPARPLALLAADLPTHTRIAAEASTGNLLEVLGAPELAVFVDDRADMFPPDVFHDALTLGRGSVGWEEVLDRHGIDVAVWASDAAIASLLRTDSTWQVAYTDGQWLIACRRGSRCSVEP